MQSTGDFLGDLSALEFQTEYRSIKDDPVGGFYQRCLQNSSYYRRAVGYFRSTVFLVVGPPVIEFARRGGRIDLICSPDLDPADVEQIATGYASRNEAMSEILIAEFDRLIADPETAAPARTLATLIALGTLELKLATRADGRGIYHEKLGVFSDTLGNAVTFKGSSNETWSGWHRLGNFESIEVFCSWRGGLETERVERHRKHFDHLWSENDPHVLVCPFPSSATDYFKKYALKGLDALTVDAASPASRRRSALPHQDAAIAGWRDQNCQGILQHATGSGKTFTAILAIRAHVERGLPTLVVVPSRLLLEQWKLELRDEVPGAALLLAGAGHDRWRTPRRLEGMTASDASLGPRIVLSTMQTASTQEFRARVMGGEHLLLVADEVHQVGSTQNSQLMNIAAGARLGLSATPTRYGDPEGTARILDYFGGVVPPPITLLDAIENGRLVPYEYHPHPVHLTATEASEWKDLTKAVRQEIARRASGAEGRGPLSDRAKMLLIKRARIAKKAAVKVRLAVQVLSAAHQPGQSWLVYCEDGGQLTDVLIALRGADLPCAEYHSGMSGDRDATMAWFRAYGGILVSIRCLDEGVDIPSVSHALILASSQNPRQFIQRRGRVLRQADGKEIAVIHDAIVVPVDADAEPDQMGLLRAELLRSIEFANHALNRAGGAELREIAVNMGLDPDSLSSTEGEEDDDGQ
jgi:superfamily II DNA or RNA helicase